MPMETSFHIGTGWRMEAVRPSEVTFKVKGHETYDLADMADGGQSVLAEAAIALGNASAYKVTKFEPVWVRKGTKFKPYTAITVVKA